MGLIAGQVVSVGDYYELGMGNRWRADYCPITLRTPKGELVQVLVSTQTMLNKTYMFDGKGGIMQVGMVKPRIGDRLEIDGTVLAGDDGFHSKVVKRVRRLIRWTKPLRQLPRE
jgi:hypothetical protein